MPQPPTLAALFVCFLRIGIQSFGGGLSAWIRREVVQQREWITDQQFLSGLALSQIAPGANAVNLAVFVGTTLRGTAGALATLAGMLLLPIVFVLALGAIYAARGALPGIEAALAGLGAAAIGMNLANGVRLTRRNVRGLRSGAVMAATALGMGVLRIKLVLLLAIMIPLSFLLLWSGEP
jgi:chromate transporter